jgi:hypothetical protein
MFFVLSKVLSFLLSPLFWVSILVVIALLKLNLRETVPQNKFKKWFYLYLQKRSARKNLIYAMVILFLCGNSVLINELNIWWEGSEGSESISDVSVKSTLP